MLRLGIPVKMTVNMTVKFRRYEARIQADKDLAKLLMIEWEWYSAANSELKSAQIDSACRWFALVHTYVSDQGSKWK